MEKTTLLRRGQINESQKREKREKNSGETKKQVKKKSSKKDETIWKKYSSDAEHEIKKLAKETCWTEQSLKWLFVIEKRRMIFFGQICGK